MSLKDMSHPFNIDSEDDLRYVVASYFSELGFETNELSFEDRFEIRLGHTVQGVEKVTRLNGRSDLLLTRNGINLAIVETKSIDHNLTNVDAEQAISYARLLRQIAPYAIVTNGRQTEIYDVFSEDLIPIPDPIEAIWAKNNQSLPSISRDLRDKAARYLVGVNSATLLNFCKQQAKTNIARKSGDVNQNRLFIPDVYVDRVSIDTHIHTWLTESSRPCFALIGDSGLGKTNFMCATADRLSEHYYVLFYSAEYLLHGSLYETIRNDFEWEFNRERSISYVINRFDDLASSRPTEFIVFIDGLDEFYGDRGALKAELIDLATRINGRAIRLCFSCKAFDWSDFVIERNQYYSELANHIYIPNSGAEKFLNASLVDARNVGIWIPKFSDAELQLAFSKYKEVFELQGDLRGHTREECSSPLILRLVSEAYRKNPVKLPEDISSEEVFTKYWERQISTIPPGLQRTSEILLERVAALMVTQDRRSIEESALYKDAFSLTELLQSAYTHVLRLGLLSLTSENNNKYLTFGFERIRSFVYTVKTLKWTSLAPSEAAKQIVEVATTNLGLEAIEFFLLNIDQGKSLILNELALRNVSFFGELISVIKFQSPIERLPKENRAEIYVKRLAQYAEFYSQITRKYLVPSLQDQILPYSRNGVGIWLSENLGLMQMRAITLENPQPITIIPNEIASQIFHGTIANDIRDLLQGAGPIQLGTAEVAHTLPHKVAWDLAHEQIAGLFSNRMLDESQSKGILNERIWNLLLYEPNAWLHGEQEFRFWEQLGFSGISEIAQIKVEDLLDRAGQLVENYLDQLPENINYRHTQGMGNRLTILRLDALSRLCYSLDLYKSLGSKLLEQPINLNTLYDVETPKTETSFVSGLQNLLPQIATEFEALARHNFPMFFNQLRFCNSPNASVYVEVIYSPGWIANLAYVILPSTKLSKKYNVVVNPQSSLSKLQLTRKVLRETWNWQGHGFAKIPVDAKIDGQIVHESEATIYFTRMSGKSLREQVYQLLGLEIQDLLRGHNIRAWDELERGTYQNDEYDMSIQRYYAGRASGLA